MTAPNSDDGSDGRNREHERDERASGQASRDYYEILGVPRDATAEELKRAYRRRARECHPDANPGDPEAAARFREAREAYETLSDPERRAEYDRTHPPQLTLTELLTAIDDLIAQFVVFAAPAQRTAVALWIAHTHSLAAFDVTPYLNVRSAEKRSGKTRLLEVLGLLVPRPWHAVQPSEAVLFRKIARDTPTLLLDEVDAVFTGPPSDRTEGLRALLNAGYRRGATVDRCVGQGMHLRAFPVFCAKALTGIGTLPDTVADRCIPIALLRRKKSEQVTKFKLREVRPRAAPLYGALAAWAEEAVARLRVARPELRDGLGDRAEEVWEPLLAVADEAGGEWPKRAWAAAVALSGGEGDAESLRVTLLGAIRDVFDDLQVNKILTLDLLRRLVEREVDPWPAWWGKEVDYADEAHPPRKAARDLARHLKPFEVRPKDVRVSDARKGKGYDRADFEDAFARYLQPRQRDNATRQGGQRAEASRQESGDARNETTETPGAQGLSRCLVTERPNSHDGAHRVPPAGEREDARPRCPRCSAPGWTPPLNGGPGHCLRCGDVTCSDREPGADDVEDDWEDFS
jgi:hypothetical protein